jgi:hypothetical protein
LLWPEAAISRFLEAFGFDGSFLNPVLFQAYVADNPGKDTHRFRCGFRYSRISLREAVAPARAA